MKNLDVVAVGACYVDMNAGDFPFAETGIAVESEIVGSTYETVPGGSAVNFCRMLDGLGLNTAFIGMSGKDVMGDVLAKLLKDASVKPFVAQNADVQTNVGFNMTGAAGEHIMCVAGTANAALHFDAIQTELEQAVADAKFLYVGGCFKLKSLSPDFEKLTAVTQKHNTLVAVDHGRVPGDVAPEMLGRVRDLVLGADYYFPSKDEFCTLWGTDNIADGVMRLAGEAPQLCVVVKDGANGAYYHENGGVQHVPAHTVDDVKDVTGAGDAFNAGVMAAVIGGHDMRSSVQYGCDVAAAKISKARIPTL